MSSLPLADLSGHTPSIPPNRADVGRVSELSTGQALDGTWRPRQADTGAMAQREGLTAVSPSRIHLIAPDLTVEELARHGIQARRMEGGAVDIVLGGGLAALRLPTTDQDWLHDAIGFTGTRDILDSIDWVERDDVWQYFLVRIDDASTMAAHGSIMDGTNVAELMTAGFVPAADLARGTRGLPTRLGAPEVQRLGAMLDWASESPTAPTPQAVDLRALPRDIAIARDNYNRENPKVEVQDGKVWTAFDMLDESPEAALAGLERSGAVVPSTPYIWGAKHENVMVDETIEKMATRIATIIASATQQTDHDLPLVFSEPGTGGNPARLLSVTPSGEIIRWDSREDMLVLLLLAIQPMLNAKDGPRPTSSIPSGVLGTVMMRLRAMCPPVEHIVHEPSIVNDRLVTKPGYDRAARTVLIMGHRDRRRWQEEYSVPNEPTEEDAQAAFEMLDALCEDFPWAAPRDRARMMAAMLTSCARSAVTASIGFLWDANEPGTGKSFAAQLCRVLGQGSKAATDWNLGRGEDTENRKHLASALLTRSTRFFHNDEVRGPINSPFVGKVITAEDGAESIRELGVNRLVPVGGIITTACGNNVTIADDHARRWFPMRLEKSLLEMATGRKYSVPDLTRHIMENRPALLAAAHTLVLRAIQQGPAFEILAMNFPPSWSQRILGALSWVMKGDTSIATQALEGWNNDVAGADPMVEAWGTALEYAWKVVDRPMPAADFAKAVLTSDVDMFVPDDLTGIGPRQLGARWSQALKRLRRRKVIVGERVFVVDAVDKGGRWQFKVDAYSMRDLQMGVQEPLVREPLTAQEQKARDARMKKEVY